MVALSVEYIWKCIFFDVENAVFNALLREEIYVPQAEGSVRMREKDLVYLLRKAL